ncbi:MAG TPA: translocation/assembly module TamB domain-containing protein [Saprospiraceae bacterium]|nr:translocation/assembly module TamB domain-containing protein [Saprospiraceae bacterium]
MKFGLKFLKNNGNQVPGSSQNKYKQLLRNAKRFLRWVTLILLGIILLLLTSILIIRTPSAQNWITQKVSKYISEKTGATITVDRLFITLNGNVALEGLQIIDQYHQKLIHTGQVELNISFASLFRNELKIKQLQWDGLKLNLIKNHSGVYNYEFLINYFINDDHTKQTKEPVKDWKINLYGFEIKNIECSVLDQYNGFNALVRLNNLSITLAPFLTLTPHIHLQDLYLNGLDAVIHQEARPVSNSNKQKEPKDSTLIPPVSIEKARFHSLRVIYHDISEQSNYIVHLLSKNLENFQFKPELDNNKIPYFHIGKTEIDGLDITHFSNSREIDSYPDFREKTLPRMVWPDISIHSGPVRFSNHRYSIKKQGIASTPDVFNKDDLDFALSKMELKKVSYANQKLSADLSELSGKEKSGFEISSLSLLLLADDQQLKLNDLKLLTAGSAIEGNLSLLVPEMNTFLSHPEMALFTMEFPVIQINPKEVFIFCNHLREYQNEFQQPVKMSLASHGTLQSLYVQYFHLNWRKNTYARMSGHIYNVTDFERLLYNIPVFQLHTQKEDFIQFLNDDLAVHIPEHIHFKGNMSGNFLKLQSDIIIGIPEGSFILNLGLDHSSGILNYHMDLETTHWTPQHFDTPVHLDSLGFKLHVSGIGVHKDNLEMNVEADIHQCILNGLALHPITLQSQIHSNQLGWNLSSDGPMNTLHSQGEMNLSGETIQYTGKVSVNHLDLKALNIWESGILSGHIESHGILTHGELAFEAYGKNLNIEYLDQHYPLELIKTKVDLFDDSTFIAIDSELIKTKIQANQSWIDIKNEISSLVQYYWSGEPVNVVDNQNNWMSIEAEIQPSGLYTQILLPAIDSMDKIAVSLWVDHGQAKMKGEAYIPYISYKGTVIKEGKVDLTAQQNTLDFFSFAENISTGPWIVREPQLEGQISGQNLKTRIQIAGQDSGSLISIGLAGHKRNDTITITIDHHNLIINNEQWVISSTNQFIYAPDLIKARNFEMKYRDHRFQLSTHDDGRPDYIRLEAENLQLENLLQWMEIEYELPKGNINAFVEADQIFDHPYLRVNVLLDSIYWNEISLGQIIAEVANVDSTHYIGTIFWEGGNVDINGLGHYYVRETGNNELVWDFDLKRIPVEILQPFVSDWVSGSQGVLNGKLGIKNIGELWEYSGYVGMEAISFTIPETASTYFIPKSQIIFDNQNLKFTDFILLDNAGNPTSINGNIILEESVAPRLDLKINSKDFILTESTRKDNDLVFGKAVADLDINVRGFITSPVITSNIHLKRGSSISIIAPEWETGVQGREGIVVIEARDYGKASKKMIEETEGQNFMGINLEAIIRVDPEVVFNILLDEKAGDHIEVAGEARLVFQIDPSGRRVLSGTYELNRGFYELRMYDIISRRFELASGSKILWSGDPLEAEMQVSAIYRLRASPLDLMAHQLSGSETSLQNQYRQELPFIIRLNIEGQILQPLLSFAMDMPETARNSLGGSVYNRIRQLNTMESELNTQVFSLLVLGRFLPQGMTAEENLRVNMEGMVRSSASRMLTGQLNALSDRYIKGLDLDLDLESFTDYRTGQPQDRTQLNVRLRRSLLNERLSVQIGGQLDLEGSQQENRQGAADILGDVSIEWTLTDDKTWGLRGFRRNQFENVVEGQVIATGISLLFNRNFNSFAELFKKNKQPNLPSDTKQD